MTVAVEKLSLTEAYARLADLIRQEKSSRIEIPVEQTDPLAWLAAQRGGAKLYWRDRDGANEIAGLGTADVALTADLTELKDRLGRRLRESGSSSGSRYFGGLRFDPERGEDTRADEWDSFGAARFVLPRVEVLKRSKQYFVAVNRTRNDRNEDIVAALAKLQRPGPFDAVTHRPHTGTDSPDRDGWIESVNRALDLIGRGAAQKLVLARKRRLLFDTTPNPWTLLDRLRSSTENCFLFGVLSGSDYTFIGATPERLYRRDNNLIESEALAGTRPRGESADDDHRLASELAASTKERWEHRLVISGIHDALFALCEECTVDDTTAPVKLARLQHLRTGLSGRLKPNITDIDILEGLHPSAAVGGYPSRKAVALLRGLEPFDRGWYAGPVGWVGNDRAEFAVGIRSALVSAKEIDLYSGAGIVSGSDPEAEWDEIESKIAPFMRLFGE